MAKAKFDIKTEATRPLYAGVGATDLVVEYVREYVADAQKKLAGVQKDLSTRVTDVQKSVREFEFEPKALRQQAVTVVNARVDALSKDAKARRAAIEARVAELQSEALAYPDKVQALVNDTVANATGTYTELVARGEKLVGRVRKQESTQQAASAAKTTTAKAKTTKTQAATATKKTAKTARSTAAKKSAAPKSSAKATATAAKKTAASAVEATTDAAEKVGD